MDILFGNDWILKGSPSGLRFLFANGEAAGYGLDLTNERYFVDRVRKSFSEAATFSRASTATMVDSTGTLVTVSANEPRIGHHVWNGSEWVNEGLLLESEARTNLNQNSNDFSSWSVTGATVTAGADSSPGGNATASLFVGGSGEATVRLRIDHSVTSSNTDTVYCRSLFIKQADQSFDTVNFNPCNSVANVSSTFDFVTGGFSFLGSAVLQSFVESFGDGWYRIGLVWDQSLRLNDTGGTIVSFNDVGDGSSGFLLFGDMLEAASTPSSYIPTSGSQATRAAETLVAPSANLPWSSDAVSLQMKGRMTYADEGAYYQQYFWRWYDSSADFISETLTTYSSFTGRVDFLQEESNVSDGVYSATDTYSPGILVPFNIASRHGSTFINGAVDGTALTENDTPTALPDLSSTDLQIGYDFNGTISLFRIWADDIGDVGIAEASS